jgi:hypothetical protein
MRFKTLSLSVLLLGFGGTVWAQPVLVKSEQKIEEYKLDNGLRIILAPNDKENKVYMNMVYLTGSLNDPSLLHETGYVWHRYNPEIGRNYWLKSRAHKSPLQPEE